MTDNTTEDLLPIPRITDMDREELTLTKDDAPKADEPNMLVIPGYNVSRLEAEVDKLNRRARKIGCPEFTIELRNVVVDVHPAYKKPGWKDKADRLPKIEWHTYEIIGQGPKINGWTFLGKLDFATLPGSVIVDAVPGETVPTEFHNAEPICNHCGKKRIRNETFVMREDATGRHELVGRQCVRDFIGYDTRQVFTFLTYIEKLINEPSEEYFGEGGYRQVTADADQVLTYAAAIIRKYGWISRGRAKDSFDNEQATADTVIEAMFPPKFSSMIYREWLRWTESLDLENPKFEAEAKAAREWLKTQDDGNEYMHNLHAIDQNPHGEVPVGLFGYWCSLVSSYQRAQERLQEAERKLKLNEHVPGKLKQRLEMTLTFDRIRVTENQWGQTYIHTFRDDMGRTVTWFASKDDGYEVGNTYKVKATIKKFDEYQNWAQTVVNRVTEIK